MTDKYHKAEHYAAILRDRATIERTVRGDEGYNGLAANFDAAADMLDIQAAKIVANDVLMKHHKSQYYELIMEVQNKHPDETRHETARRYIREHETPCAGCRGDSEDHTCHLQCAENTDKNNA